MRSKAAACTTRNRIRTLLVAPTALAILLGSAGAFPAESDLQIEIHHDPRVFTLFVLLNLTGYDLENACHFHPVRQHVRETLISEIPEALLERFRQFKQEHPAHPWHYQQLCLRVSLPDIGIKALREQASHEQARQGQGLDIEIETEREVLQSMLQEVWALPAVRGAFEEIRDEAMARGEDWHDAIVAGRAQAIAYLRLDATKLRCQHFLIVNLLDSHATASMHTFDGATCEIRGPRKENDNPPRIAGPHEFLHMLVADVVRDSERLRRFHEKLLGVFVRAMSYPRIRENYASIDTFVEECLVRALNEAIVSGRQPLTRATDGKTPPLLDEALQGFLLEPWLYAKLEAYEQGEASFAEWLDRTIEVACEQDVMDGLGALGVAPAMNPIQCDDISVAGIWQGSIRAGGEDLDLAIHLDKNAQGEVCACLDVPAQGIAQWPFSDGAFENALLKLELAPLRVSIEARLSADGSSFDGRFLQDGEQQPIVLRRAAAREALHER